MSTTYVKMNFPESNVPAVTWQLTHPGITLVPGSHPSLGFTKPLGHPKIQPIRVN